MKRLLVLLHVPLLIVAVPFEWLLTKAKLSTTLPPVIFSHTPGA